MHDHIVLSQVISSPITSSPFMKYEKLFKCKKTCKIGSGLKRLFYMAESISPAIKIDILKLFFFPAISC